MTGMTTQTVYIEYAFLENAFLDGLLLLLALKYSGCRRTPRLLIGCFFGGVAAVVFPLLHLPIAWAVVYKIATGALLPVLSTKEQLGRTFFCVGLFFAFSFAVAGGTFALASFLPLPSGGYYFATPPLVLLVLLFLSVACILSETAWRLRRRKMRAAFFVDCAIEGGGVEWRGKGYVDTGNFAFHLGVPICFLAPKIFSALPSGLKTGYATVKTVSGEKKIAVVKMDKIRITHGGQTHIINGAYVSPSLSLVGKEYEMLLGAWAYG